MFKFNSIEKLPFKRKRKSAFCASGYVRHFLYSDMQINFPLKLSLWQHSFLFDSEVTRHYLEILQQVYSINDGPNYFLTLVTISLSF